jgi:FlaA1/EpsC-like NDP-sugar epimerase
MKKIFITGGSGTVGSSFIKEYRNDYLFSSYSRNEKMQVALKRTFNEIEIHLGAIEDYEALLRALRSVEPDIVIHAAALKHIDTGEKNPIEASKININGSLNVIKACTALNVPQVIGISTDKACCPDSVYGYSKLLMEKMFLQAHSLRNKFCICRFGNVTYSHGSVLPYWLGLLREKKDLSLTSKKMNRLMFSRKEAARLLEYAIQKSASIDQPFVLSKKMKNVNMYKLACALSDNIKEVGLRPGEKLNETLISEKELPFCSLEGEYIILQDGAPPRGSSPLQNLREYSSLTAPQMTPSDLNSIILEGKRDDLDPLLRNLY